MRFACWIPKATNTHTHTIWIMFIGFHCNNGCTNAIHCYVTCSLPLPSQKPPDQQWGPLNLRLNECRVLCRCKAAEASRAEFKNEWSYTSTPRICLCEVKDNILLLGWARLLKSNLSDSYRELIIRVKLSGYQSIVAAYTLPWLPWRSMWVKLLSIWGRR